MDRGLLFPSPGRSPSPQPQADTPACASPHDSSLLLTTKVEGKTVTLYVRKDLVLKALEMGRRYKKLWSVIQKLSKVNWEILKLENE